MKDNLAHWDRALHFAFGLFFGLLGQRFHWFFYFLAAYFIVVALLAFDPLYKLFKISTKQK